MPRHAVGFFGWAEVERVLSLKNTRSYQAQYVYYARARQRQAQAQFCRALPTGTVPGPSAMPYLEGLLRLGEGDRFPVGLFRVPPEVHHVRGLLGELPFRLQAKGINKKNERPGRGGRREDIDQGRFPLMGSAVQFSAPG